MKIIKTPLTHPPPPPPNPGEGDGGGLTPRGSLRVKRLNLLRPALVHLLPLDLERRGQLIVGDGEVAGQDLELLDLLHLGELAVHLVDVTLNLFLQGRARRQLLGLHAVRVGPGRALLGVDGAV